MNRTRVPFLGFQIHSLSLRSQQQQQPPSSSATTATTSRIYRFNDNTSSMSPEFAVSRAIHVFAFLSISLLLIYGAVDSFRFISSSSSFSNADSLTIRELDDSKKSPKIEDVLGKAAMKDGTVILTTLNEAWATPSSIVDLFLESFGVGEGTRKLLNHLVIVALDRKAYLRCLQLHSHCLPLVTPGIDFSQEAYFMTPTYLKMMWSRIEFLGSVLELGYHFVFTDADVMWFRDPFPQFYSDADFQIACDHFTGSSIDRENRPNGGFSYVKSNNRSIQFYKFWYSSQHTYPGYHDQDVLNMIKSDSFVKDLGLKMRFLDTAFFGGLCEPSRDLSLVCTMHANCCFGLDSKLSDLRIMLEDWKSFLSLPPNLKRYSLVSWRVPQNCSLASLRPFGSPESSTEPELGE